MRFDALISVCAVISARLRVGGGGRITNVYRNTVRHETFSEDKRQGENGGDDQLGRILLDLIEIRSRVTLGVLISCGLN